MTHQSYHHSCFSGVPTSPAKLGITSTHYPVYGPRLCCLWDTLWELADVSYDHVSLQGSRHQDVNKYTVYTQLLMLSTKIAIAYLWFQKCADSYNYWQPETGTCRTFFPSYKALGVQSHELPSGWQAQNRLIMVNYLKLSSR